MFRAGGLSVQRFSILSHEGFNGIKNITKISELRPEVFDHDILNGLAVLRNAGNSAMCQEESCNERGNKGLALDIVKCCPKGGFENRLKLLDDLHQRHRGRTLFFAGGFECIPTSFNITFKVFVVHAATDVVKVFTQLSLVLQTVDFSLLQGFSIIGGVFEGREQFCQGHRASFIATDPFVEKRRQHFIGASIQHRLGEKERFIVVFTLPTKTNVVFPNLFFHGLNFIKQHSGLVVKHLPRQANQSSTCGKIKVFAVFHPLCKDVQER